MKVATLLVTTLVLAVLLAGLGGWLFMLLLGAAHSYDPMVPALGFAPSFFVALAIRVAASDAKATKS